MDATQPFEGTAMITPDTEHPETASATSRLGAHLSAFLCALFLGLTFLSTQWLYTQGMGPWAVLMWRSVLAYGVLLFLSPGRLLSGNVRDELRIALLGIVSALLYMGLQNQALAHTQAATVSILAATAPLLAALLSMLWLRRTSVPWNAQLGLWSAATGVFLLLFDLSAMQALPLTGAWLALAAAGGWALESLLLRSLTAYSPSFVARKAMGYGMLALLPFYLSEETTSGLLLTDPLVLTNIAFLAFAATALSSVLWLRAAHTLGSATAAPWLHLAPFVTVAGGFILFDEALSFVGLMGALLILCGVHIAHRALARIAFEVARRG